MKRLRIDEELLRPLLITIVLIGFAVFLLILAWLDTTRCEPGHVWINDGHAKGCVTEQTWKETR